MHNQNNTNNLAQFISIAIFSVLFGGISGLIWAFVLSKNFKSALILGASIGLFLGLTSILKQKSSSLTKKESSFFAGSIITTLFILSTILAVIYWLISFLIKLF